MKVQVVIPARFGSQRFPGKPLHIIRHRPLIQWTFEAASATGWPVMIATDDDEIAAVARDFGADVEMTGECANGTERVAEAIANRGIDPDFVVNWQGDSPLCPEAFARVCVAKLQSSMADVATPVMAIDTQARRRLLAEQAAGVPGATTCVLGSCRALYFSKAVLPGGYLHVGLYAYRMSALSRYGRAECAIERIEGLEQLRFLDMGLRVDGVVVPQRPIWEVNLPRDVQIVADLLRD